MAEVVGIEEGTVQLNKIFQWNPENDEIENVAVSSKTLTEISKLSGKSINELYEEISNRQIVLQHMLDYNIRSVGDVNNILGMYYENPRQVLNRIMGR